MERKQITMQIGAQDVPEGTVRAVFARLNVVDRDGDLTLPGAFPQNAPVSMLWSHDYDALPIGKGTIHEEGDLAIFDGRFNLDSEAGREAYSAVKFDMDHSPPLIEWSYSYDPVDFEYQTQNGQQVRVLKKLRVYEVSPVFLGAGIGTGTLAVKAAKNAIAVHHTDVVDEPWDGPEMEARLPSEREALRAAHAWVDPEGNPDAKSSYKFIHHMVSADGEVGPANVIACRTGIAILNGARGGADIPDGDREGVYRHLAAHLRDAGIEPPELKSGLWQVPYSEQDVWLREALQSYIDHTRARIDLRAKEGRVLSRANRERLQALLDALREAAADIEDLLKATEPSSEADAQKAAELLRQFLRTQACYIARVSGTELEI